MIRILNRISVQKRVLAVSVIPVISSLIFFSYLITNERLSDNYEAVRVRGDTLSNLVRDLSPTALITGNDRYIKSSLDSLLNENLVISISVVAKNGTPLYSGTKGIRHSDPRFIFTKPVFLNNMGEDTTHDTWNENQNNISAELLGKVQVIINPSTMQITEYRIYWETALFFVITLGGSILIALVIGSSITTPIKMLQKIITNITRTQGRWHSEVIRIPGNDEFSQFSLLIEAMAHEIDRVTTAYENRLDELTSAKVNADYADRSKDEIRKALVRTNERIDEERKRITRKLHDIVNQRILTSNKELEWVLLSLNKNPSSNTQKVSQSIERAIQENTLALQESRSIIKMTRIEVLDALGFIKGVGELVDSYQSIEKNIHFTFQTDTTDYIPGEQSITPYRIIQEALRNAVTHSKCNNIAVDITKQGTATYHIKISDDGIGLDIKKKKIGSIGLFDMRERAAMLGSTLYIDAKHGKGTELQFTFNAALSKNKLTSNQE